MVVVSLVTFAETAHPTQVISKLARVTENVKFCLDDKNPRKFMCCGSVNGKPVSAICIDTGCSSVMISDYVFPDAITTNVPNVDVYDYLGRVDTFPVIKCYLRCSYYTGWVNAIRAPIKFCSVLVGNISGVLDPNHKTKNFEAVTTRSSAVKSSPIHPLILSKLDPIKVDHVQFKNLQLTCAITLCPNIFSQMRSVTTLEVLYLTR